MLVYRLEADLFVAGLNFRWLTIRQNTELGWKDRLSFYSCRKYPLCVRPLLELLAEVADKWDEFFMSCWAQRRMKMGLGREVVPA